MNTDNELKIAMQRARQEERELQQWQEIIDSVNVDASTAHSSVFRKYINDKTPQLLEAATVLVNKCEASSVAAKSQVGIADFFTMTLEPTHIVACFVNVLQSEIFANSGQALTRLSTTLARNLKDCRAVQQLIHRQKAASGENVKTDIEKVIERNGMADRRKIRKWIERDSEFVEQSLDTAQLVAVGSTVFEALLPVVSDLFELHLTGKMVHGVYASTYFVRLKEDAREDLVDSLIDDALATTSSIPMVCPPNKMTPETIDRRHRYMLPRYRGRDVNFTPSAAAINALNAIQSVSWKINQFMLDVASAVSHDVDMLSQALSIGADPVRPAVVDDWEALSDDEARAQRRAMAAYHINLKSNVYKRQLARSTLKLAADYRDEAEIFFPHIFDFRGRIYPNSRYLNPQSGDLAKSLLLFTNGQPLGERGLYWLKVEIANTCGMDKALYDERVAWVDENIESIKGSVADPLNDGFWLNAAEPFMALASMVELVNALECDDPTSYVCHKPVNVDGVCNGMQVLSLMGKDKDGAVSTNVIDTGVRRDFYMEVAGPIAGWLKESDNEHAPYWLAQFEAGKGRKIVKRGCMTTPYGVTERGIASQLESDGFCQGLAPANFMAGMIVRAMSNAAPKAMAIKGWLVECSTVMCKHDVSPTWRTPTGSTVHQVCMKSKDVRLTTPLGRLQIRSESPDKIDTAANSRGITANIVHSFDAAMLAKTANALVAAGIDDHCWIHDSYGVHPNNVDTLHRVLREAAVDMFEGDTLEELRLDFEDALGGEVEIPAAPTAGELNVADVKNSQYFFS